MIRTWNPNTIQPNKHACRPLHVQDNAFRFRLSFRSMATMKDKSSKRIQSESLIEQDVVEETIDDEKDGQRLSKVLAQMGISSRRKAEEIIVEGRVKVNGQCVLVPQTLVKLKTDKIVVDGKEMHRRQPKKYYFVLNKPTNYLCSSKAETKDGKRTKIVLDLFDDWMKKWKEDKSKKSIPPRLFTVGRLDKQSWGLLFVTNDGDWAQKVMHPSTGLTKEYVVKTIPEAKMEDIEMMAEGCVVDGKYVQPVGIAKDSDFLRIVVSDGRKREVRTFVEYAGLKVKSLKRVRIGGYRLPSDLKVGEFKELRPHERRQVLSPVA